MDSSVSLSSASIPIYTLLNVALTKFAPLIVIESNSTSLSIAPPRFTPLRYFRKYGEFISGLKSGFLALSWLNSSTFPKTKRFSALLLIRWFFIISELCIKGTLLACFFR